MKDRLELVVSFGPQFAREMTSRLQTEANGSTATGQAYKLPDALRQELIACAAQWKEVVILYEYMKSLNVDFNKKPYGLRVISNPPSED